MHQTLARNPDLRLVMELNPEALRRSGTTAARLGALLEEVGFRRGWVIERGMRPCDLPALPATRALYNLVLATR